MKLCIVTHSLIKGSGQGRVNYEVVQEAIARGHQITLLASAVAAELQQNNQVSWVPVSVKGWPTELLRNTVFSQRSASWLRQHRREFDLVKVNGAITNAQADVNAVHFVHSSWLQSPAHISRSRRDYYGAYQWCYTALNAYWEKQAFSRAKVVVAVSNKVSQELIDIGVPQEKIRVMFNGVDAQEFCPAPANRQKLGLPEKVPLALFVGDIRLNRKNLDTVLHALVKVPELHLAVVGEIEGSPYPQLAAKLELGARVHFLGYRHDVAKIMQAVDLFVFPSRYEPFGMVVSEAMASGLPVITAATTGAAEIVTPNCGMVLADTEDTQALAQALSKLASDRELGRKMGQAARVEAEKYSWKKMAQSYVDLFEKLTS
ncbi:MAG: glycosyltransferase family 4 protein [Symploca sp. SIO3E6]|nr:glycosyltransferase family 4 protein [Caldora sp. SIO3E6]